MVYFDIRNTEEYKMKLVKKVQPEWFLYVLLLFPFAMGPLNDFLGLPRAIRYVMDLAYGMLLVLAAARFRQINWGESKRLAIWVGGFVAYTLIAYMFHFQSPLYYLWGFRNNFRFYAAFFAFVIFLTSENVERILKWLDILFWVNFAVSLIQFFGFGLQQDYLGGIFGTEPGVNGYTNIFFLIIITKAAVSYQEGYEKLWVFLSKCAAALLIAALAELKFFYIEFLGIIILSVLFIRFKMRNLWIIPAGLVAAMLSAALLSKLFPYFQDWLSVRWFLQEASAAHGYTYSGDLNRLTAIPAINNYWLTSLPQRLFGLGLGNTDTSSFAFLNTPFFMKYWFTNYLWISYAIMYLECGWIGLLFYFVFFVLVFLAAHRIQKKSEGMTRVYCLMAKILVPFCMLIAIYNSSLRMESAYMMYFALALPFAFQSKNTQRNDGKAV